MPLTDLLRRVRVRDKGLVTEDWHKGIGLGSIVFRRGDNVHWSLAVLEHGFPNHHDLMDQVIIHFCCQERFMGNRLV